jgi:hypothetical protein
MARVTAYRVSVAILCTLLLSGAILGTTANCGRKTTSSRPTCCKNEAMCPMHQKSAPGFNTCEGDGTTMTAAVAHHRAVLSPAVVIAGVPQRDQSFETETVFLPSIPVVPTTPPPRTA